MGTDGIEDESEGAKGDGRAGGMGRMWRRGIPLGCQGRKLFEEFVGKGRRKGEKREIG